MEHAKRAVMRMTVDRDAMLGPVVLGLAATVSAWAGQGDEAVQLLRRANAVPNFVPARATVRDPLLAVPLTSNSTFEVLKREVEPD